MNQKEGKEKILNAAYALLISEKDLSKITIKAIAESAGVGIGLINYHFKSKDLLFMEAISVAMSTSAERWREKAYFKSIDPKLGLSEMLLDLMQMGSDYMRLTLIAAKFELTEGEISTPFYILPYIKRITEKDEQHCRLIAFNLISGLQSASIRRNYIKSYLDLDIEIENDRKKYVQMLIDTII